MSPSKRFGETHLSVQGDPQDLSLSEQCCDECGASFVYMKMEDGDCSHQHPNYCPSCGRKVHADA